MLKTTDCGYEELGFWEELETKRGVKRYNPTNDYSKSFNTEYLELLQAVNNLPEMPELSEGTIVTGIIEKINRKEIVININYKDTVFVDNKSADLKIIENLYVGDELDVMITSIVDAPYQLKGSITELIKMKVATKLKEFFSTNEAIVAKVTDMIPAGFMLDIDMDNIIINAFMPNTLAGVNRLTSDQSAELVGQKIHVLLESLQQEKGVYVVSRKKYLQTLIPEEVKKLKKGQEYVGTVTGSKDFGVFVEFSADGRNRCLTGMIHKVNMLPELAGHIESIAAGTSIKFYVRDILKGNKIILSQVIRESLWDNIKVGQVRDAVVTGVKNFGVLVALDDETFGLIQNSYLQKANVTFTQGQKIQVKVVSVIKDDRKIYLSLPE